MDQDDKKIRTIAALLAKANDPAATEAERDSYNDKATQLMITYGIEQARIDAAAGTDGAIEKITQVKIEYTGTYGPELMKLAHRVGDALGLRSYQVIHRNAGSRKTVYLVGFESDVDFCRLILGSLTIQCMAAVDRHMKNLRDTPQWKHATAGDKYKQRRAFIVGFIDTVAKRLRFTREETIRVATTVTAGTDIVLANRITKIDDWMEDAVGPLKQVASKRQYTFTGYDAGASAGNKADIGQSGVSNTSGAKAIH